jgi:hypothetical protein
MPSPKPPACARTRQVRSRFRRLLVPSGHRPRAAFTRCVLVSFLFFALSTVPPAQAASTIEVLNGGTCIAYPPYNPATSTFTGVNYQHWLYGFDGIAFCHIAMPGEWPVTALSAVVFNGSISSGVLRARLCVHSGTATVTCGAESTITAALR